MTHHPEDNNNNNNNTSLFDIAAAQSKVNYNVWFSLKGMWSVTMNSKKKESNIIEIEMCCWQKWKSMSVWGQ